MNNSFIKPTQTDADNEFHRGLKYKRRILYFPMDFGEITLYGLVDTGAPFSAIPEVDLRKIRLLAPQSIIKEGPAPNFQIMVANGQLENPKSTVELKFRIGDLDFHEIFIVMEKLTSPLVGLSFLHRNNTISDMRQGCPQFPFFSQCNWKQQITNTLMSWNRFALGRMLPFHLMTDNRAECVRTV